MKYIVLCTHFIDEDAQAWKVKLLALNHSATEWYSQELNPRQLIQALVLINIMVYYLSY